MNWTEAIAELPLIAILRGIKPEEAEAVPETLYEAGFRRKPLATWRPRARSS